MIDPKDIDIVYGGGSSETPARDYIVVGGTSSTDERDYVIFYSLHLTTEAGSVYISSTTTNIIKFQSLESGSIYVTSSFTDISNRLSISALSSTIQVISPQANLKNNYLVGLASSILIGSGQAELRFIPKGYLPEFPPTNLSFIPPKYGIDKTYVMSGKAMRRLMCSKPSNAALTLEYENISDTVAQQVDVAYTESYGTRYGFVLPSAVIESAGSDLSSYMQLLSSNSRWYFDDKPVIRSVIKGVASLSVQLKSRVDAR